jgi:NitT/TauT family transport system substrate-binding protein
MKKANPTNTDEFMMFSRKMILDEKLVTGRDAGGGPARIGRLDPARFTTQIGQLEDLGMLPKGKVKAATAITTDFLP